MLTKLLRPLTKYWRAQGLKVVIYLDDGIVATKGFEAANRASLIVRNDLQRAGLVVNIQKSIWLPAQALTWLGFDLDLSQGVHGISANIQN